MIAWPGSRGIPSRSDPGPDRDRWLNRVTRVAVTRPGHRGRRPVTIASGRRLARPMRHDGLIVRPGAYRRCAASATPLVSSRGVDERVRARVGEVPSAGRRGHAWSPAAMTLGAPTIDRRDPRSASPAPRSLDRRGRPDADRPVRRRPRLRPAGRPRGGGPPRRRRPVRDRPGARSRTSSSAARTRPARTTATSPGWPCCSPACRSRSAG